jgi:hypothetical protein
LDLTDDDFRIAEEFASRLARDYDLLDILEKYRSSKYHRMFLLWVQDSLRRLEGEASSGRPLVERLKELFQESANRLTSTGIGIGGVAGAVSAYELFLHHPATEKMLDAIVSRRMILRMAGVIGGGILGATVLKVPISEGVAETSHHNEDWIALIAGQATQRNSR